MEQSEQTWSATPTTPTTPTTTTTWMSGDQQEGMGAFGWAILSALLVIGVAVGLYSAYALR
ncbi:MAG TPA: hypothetical protein VE338_06910 [Ktedonobacterales bacterium]|jgi:hypothetical protein|nr:hypothetical protein [Ktedonobacterales bacterium]